MRVSPGWQSATSHPGRRLKIKVAEQILGTWMHTGPGPLPLAHPAPTWGPVCVPSPPAPGLQAPADSTPCVRGQPPLGCSSALMKAA